MELGAQNEKRYFKELKQIGLRYTPYLIQKIKARHPYPYDPNVYPWQEFLSPIEKNVWNAIRALGMPFYPQFPVGRYHVDFADPIFKLAIEADGAAYHNKKKDDWRDFQLDQKGWTIYRIEGRDTKIQTIEDNYGIETEIFPLDDFLKSICEIHYPHIIF